VTRVIGWCVLAALLVGCSAGTGSTQKTTYSYVDEDQANAAKQGETFEDPSKIAPSSSVTEADMKKLKSHAAVAKSAMAGNANTQNKKKYADATVDLAIATMYDTKLDRHERYGTALRLFREALAVDPTNRDAQAAADTIVSIYNQMGRPVPK
jgi:hypothetical protein